MALLEVKNLEKDFKEVKAVDDISFKVQKGEIFGLLGPNGAGKSTTISIISTLLKPTKGDIKYKGESIVKNSKLIQPKLGVVPQEIALYPELSGYENLKFWGHAYNIRGKKLKKRIEDVSEIIGVKERLKDKISKYSGGMKRRINIGAALLHEPELLIMDEPTVGIDPQSRNHILETVNKLNEKGTTVIYTSHYMEEVEAICTRINIMDKGKIIASGTKDELIEIINGNKKINLKFDKVSQSLIKDLESIEYISKLDVSENEIIISSNNGENIFKDITEVVTASDSSLISIDINKPNLEAVFLHLTGRALRD
ncbi:MAG: ABC transporter ATP-binding protein [Firmicutes bacterium]|nr:ABC transporter ATP-binding protein [Bacillota bacterium]